MPLKKKTANTENKKPDAKPRARNAVNASPTRRPGAMDGSISSIPTLLLASSFAVAKAFHVSPFMPLDMDYHLRFSLDAAHVRIHMQNWQGGRKVFEADLALRRTPLDGATLRRYVLNFPWMSLRTVSAIYWQALRLWLKKVPFFPIDLWISFKVSFFYFH